MAKICTQCNLKHTNDATKCVQCGSELEVIKSDLKKKKIIITSIISILLVAIIIFAVMFFTGPKARVRSVMRNLKNGNSERVVDSCPDFIIDYFGGEDMFEKLLEEYVEVQSEYIVSYNIDKVVSPSSNEKTQILEYLDYFEENGYDESKLDDIKIAWLNIQGGFAPGFLNSNLGRFLLIKYDGRWYWVP